MTPSLASYLAGSLSLVLIAATLGFGAYHLRRWIVPAFSGALARLAELVLAISLLVLSLQLLGTVGLLRAGWIPAACAAAGLGVGLLARSRAPADGRARTLRPPRAPTGALLIAVGVASWSLAEWTIPTQLALDRGMFGGDTTWYHMPFSARFAQEHSIVHLHFTDPLRLAVWFYPQTYELLSGASIAMFKSDFLVPLMNLGWLGLALLAAWCIGRPYGVAPATLVAAALVFDSGVMWETQAGEARNDIMALALLLAFAALLVNGHHQKTARIPGAPPPGRSEMGPLLVGGLAAGLAVSAKLTMLVPVGAIALGIVLVYDSRVRRRTLWILAGALLLTGAYWYGRNLVHSGNPLPFVEGIGPIELPHPDQMQLSPRPPYSVADYLLEPTIHRRWFFPQLVNALGPLWALVLGGGIVSAIYIVVRARNPVLRVLAGAVLLTAVIYVLTPITASGPYGQPKGFFSNTRYLMTALVLGLALLPLAQPLRERERRRRQVLAALTATFAITVLTTPGWLPGFTGGLVLLTGVVIWIPLALAWLRSEWRLKPVGIAAIALAAAVPVVLLGRAQQVEYAQARYTDPEPFFREVGPVEAFTWARETRDQRIGVVGSGQVFFTQYGWYGSDLSNHVQYVGVDGPNGAFTVPATCRELRTSVNAGDYDYVVATKYGTNNTPGEDSPAGTWREDFPVRAWLKDDPALEQILAEDVFPQPDWVYRVDGELDPAGCRGR